MKKWFYLLAMLFAFAVVLPSCSDDEDKDAPFTPSDIVGMWMPYSCSEIYKVNGVVEDEDNSTDYMYIVEFNADGTFNSYGQDDGVKYETGTYSVSNGQLILTQEFENGTVESYGWQILSLTSDEVVLYSYEKDDEDPSMIYEYAETLVYHKISE